MKDCKKDNQINKIHKQILALDQDSPIFRLRWGKEMLCSAMMPLNQRKLFYRWVCGEISGEVFLKDFLQQQSVPY